MPSDFKEKTLENIIIDNQKIISERGLPPLYKNNIRQFRLPSGKIMDIFSFELTDNDINCRVIELKLDKLNIAAVLQLIDYCTELFFYLSPHFQKVNIHKILVGADYDKDIKTLTEASLKLDIYLYKYCVNGIFFKKKECITTSKNPIITELLSKPTVESASLIDTLLLLAEQPNN